MGGLVWGLLCVAMVAWGMIGVGLICAVAAVIGVGIAAGAYRRRR